ncbi:MAG: ABC transporter ATP-binding protein [Deltaproteobacteria bacterium]|nr:ABC transporter ATP-binding protein [Deltaproteobacteria bacterium]
MRGEYGYMEEGQLGRAYNLRLLRRLGGYALPHRKIILIALLLSVVITLADLVVPYLSKVAIDRYILSSWHRIYLKRTSTEKIATILEKLAPVMTRSKDGSFSLISQVEIKKLDPADFHALREEGLISEGRYYLLKQEARDLGREKDGISLSVLEMEQGFIAIPTDELSRLKPQEIIRLRGRDLRGVAAVGLLLFSILLLSLGLGYGEFYFLERAGQNIMQDIRLALFQRMQSPAVSFFDRHPVGRLVTRVTNDVENLNEMFKSVFITVFKDVFILSGILAMLLYLNWRLALVCFVLIPPIFGLALLFSYLAREAFRELRSKVAKMNTFLQERITGMRIIKLFAREDHQMDQFKEINHEYYLAGMKQIRVFAVFMPLMELLSSFGIGLLVWYGGGKVLDEQLTLGSLVAFISYIRMFFRPIQDISEKYNIMQAAMASLERIFEFMDHEEVIPDPPRPRVAEHNEGYIHFDRVSFAYQEGRPVLKEITFEVKPGEVVAIVGATGAGKTTVVNLIERFYDGYEGRISLDGIDIREWRQEELHRRIGLVMQDVFIFSGTVMENISLGDEGIGQEDILKAAREANALSFIEKLPKGFQQEIGERGSNLSAGERQLLSFARALACNPRVLILDEATSSVDPETERLIQEAIGKMTRRRTTLVIAHRLSTIRNADRIIVMHQGRIIEEGTHESLLTLGGTYARLSKLRTTYPGLG